MITRSAATSTPPVESSGEAWTSPTTAFAIRSSPASMRKLPPRSPKLLIVAGWPGASEPSVIVPLRAAAGPAAVSGTAPADA